MMNPLTIKQLYSVDFLNIVSKLKLLINGWYSTAFLQSYGSAISFWTLKLKLL